MKQFLFVLTALVLMGVPVGLISCGGSATGPILPVARSISTPLPAGGDILSSPAPSTTFTWDSTGWSGFAAWVLYERPDQSSALTAAPELINGSVRCSQSDASGQCIGRQSLSFAPIPEKGSAFTLIIFGAQLGPNDQTTEGFDVLHFPKYTIVSTR